MTKIFSPNENVRDPDGTLRWGMVIRKTLLQQAITVGTGAVKLPTSALSNRINILIFNNSTSGQILYLGDSTVTTVNGFPLYPRASVYITIEDEVDIYGISSAAGADIRLLEGS